MYKLGAYNQNNRMSDLVCDNYPVLLVIQARYDSNNKNHFKKNTDYGKAQSFYSIFCFCFSF